MFRKRLLLAALSVSAGAVFAISCSRTEQLPQAADGQFHYIFSGESIPSESTKISIGEVQAGLWPCLWHSEDALAVCKTVGGTCMGQATLISGAGGRKGSFELTSSAQPGTEVRLLYPSGASFGWGSLPSSQHHTLDNISDISSYTYAYSEPLFLNNEDSLKFSMTHAMSFVRISCSCVDLPSSAKITGAKFRTIGNPLSGKFTIDYETCSVTASQNAEDYVTLSFDGEGPALTASPTDLWLSVLPTEEVVTCYVSLYFECGGSAWCVPFKFTTSLKSGAVNSLDATSFKMSDAAKKVNLVIIGDSTAATVKYTSTTSQRGWGQMLQYFFDSDMINVVNCAKAGCSTKSYRSDGYWSDAKKNLSTGDRLLIQFGHNDEDILSEKGTTPQEYRDNLCAYINEARAVGAKPVLLTPILRRRFVDNVVQDDIGDRWTHVKYAPMVYTVADSLNVPLVDALELSRAWLNSIGDEASKNSYVWFRAGDYASTPDGKQDNTHLNQHGAYTIADMIANGLGMAVDRLAPHIVSCDYSKVEQDMGVIKIFYPDGGFGTAGEFASNTLGRDIEKPVPGSRPDTLGFEVYRYPDGLELSDRYSVSVEGFDATVFPTTYPSQGDYTVPLDKQSTESDDPNYCVFSSDREVTVKVRFLKNAPSSVQIRPLYKKYNYSLSGDELTVKLNTYDRVSIETDGDLLHPLFIFVNPCEWDEYLEAIKDPNAHVLEEGQIYTSSLNLAGCSKLFIRGGAVVRNCFNHQYAISGAQISGCGIIDARAFVSPCLMLAYADGVTVSNLTLINKRNWTARFVGCNNCTIDNIKVVAACPFNDNWDENDAFHLQACQNCTLNRCFGYSWDDAFVVNSSRTGSDADYSRDTYGIHFYDCVAWNVRPGNSFEIGWTNINDVHDVDYKWCCAIHSGTKNNGNHRAAFSIQNAHKGSVYNILYENCYGEDLQECGITATILKGKDYGTTWQAGKVYGITYRNVSIANAPKWGFDIQGYDSSHKVSTLTFENITVAGNKVTSLTDTGVASSRYPAKYYEKITFE